jgi:hypothetical protein
MPALTTQITDDTYRAAARALKRIIADPEAAESHAAAAEKEFDRLNANYIGWSTDNIAKRTAAFETFIANMNTLLKGMKDDPALNGVKKLREIVDGAKTILET